MDFKDSIKQLADKVAQLKDGILTEEATKKLRKFGLLVGNKKSG